LDALESDDEEDKAKKAAVAAAIDSKNVNKSGYVRPTINHKAMLDAVSNSFEPNQSAFSPFQALLGAQQQQQQQQQQQHSQQQQQQQRPSLLSALRPNPNGGPMSPLSSLLGLDGIDDEDEDDDLEPDEQAVLDQFDLSTTAGQLQAYNALSDYIMAKKNKEDPLRFGMTPLPPTTAKDAKQGVGSAGGLYIPHARGLTPGRGNGNGTAQNKNDNDDGDESDGPDRAADDNRSIAPSSTSTNTNSTTQSKKKPSTKTFPLYQWARVTPDGHIIKKVLEHGYPSSSTTPSSSSSSSRTIDLSTERNIGINLPVDHTNNGPDISFFDPAAGNFESASTLTTSIPSIDLPVLQSSHQIQTGTPPALTRAYGLLSIRVYDFTAMNKKKKETREQRQQQQQLLNHDDDAEQQQHITAQDQSDIEQIIPDLLYSSLNEEVGILLGHGQSLSGLEVAISTMNVGERALILSSSKYGGKMEYLGAYQHPFRQGYLTSFCSLLGEIKSLQRREMVDGDGQITTTQPQQQQQQQQQDLANLGLTSADPENTPNPAFFKSCHPVIAPTGSAPPTPRDISTGSLRAMLTHTIPLHPPTKIVHSSTTNPSKPHFPPLSTCATPYYTTELPQDLASPPVFIPKMGGTTAPLCELTKPLHIIHNITYNMILVALRQHKRSMLKYMSKYQHVLSSPVPTTFIPPFEGRLSALASYKPMQFLQYQPTRHVESTPTTTTTTTTSATTLAMVTNNKGKQVNDKGTSPSTTPVHPEDYIQLSSPPQSPPSHPQPFYKFTMSDSDQITIPLINDKYYQDIILSGPNMATTLARLPNSKTILNQLDKTLEALIKTHQKQRLPSSASSSSSTNPNPNAHINLPLQPGQAETAGMLNLCDGDYVLEFDFNLTRFEKEANLHTMDRAEKLTFIQQRRHLGKLLYQEFGKFQSAAVQYTKAVTIVEDDYISEHQAHNRGANPDPESTRGMHSNNKNNTNPNLDIAPQLGQVRQQVLPQLIPNERKHLSILLYTNILQSWWQFSYYMTKWNGCQFYANIITNKFADTLNVKIMWYKFRIMWYLGDLYQANHLLKLCIVKCDELRDLFQSGRFIKDIAATAATAGLGMGMAGNNHGEEGIDSQSNLKDLVAVQDAERLQQLSHATKISASDLLGQDTTQDTTTMSNVDLTTYPRYNELVQIWPKIQQESKLFQHHLRQHEASSTSKMKGFLLPSHYDNNDNNGGGGIGDKSGGDKSSSNPSETKGKGFLADQYTTIDGSGQTQVNLGLYDDKPLVAETKHSSSTWKSESRCSGIMNGLRLTGWFCWQQSKGSWDRFYDYYFGKEWKYRGKKSR
jgi:hypothetical protein